MRFKWKTVAVIFIVLFLMLLTINLYAYWSYNHDLKVQNECYYNLCSEYPEASLEGDVCYCYDYDLLGELQVVDTVWIE